MVERKGLGRGLSAFIADMSAQDIADEGPARRQLYVPIDKIRPNPDQPRREFDQQSLGDLTASISEKGIIQPLIVREDPTDPDFYQIVAGERRWRAAQSARLHDAPVVIRELDDGEVLEIAIIENIQRADLNPVEEALGFQQLQEKFGHTQDQLARALGKSRSHIANLMRLLKLPDDVLGWLKAGKITAGHARALITSDDPSALARHVMDRNLSVRETERLANSKAQTNSPSKPIVRKKDADSIALERNMSAALGLKVVISHNTDGQAGKISIDYKNLSQLDDLCRRIAKSDEF